MSVTTTKEFAVIASRAKAVARNQGAEKLTPQHFLTAVWIVHRAGHLAAHPTLNAHVKAHSDAICAAVDSETVEQALQSLAISAEQEASMALDDAMKVIISAANLKEHGDDANQLLVFLNQLMEPGIQQANLRSVAYHEAGHAVVSLLLRPEVRLGRATIKAEENAAGSVSFVDRHGNTSQEDFLDSLCVAMAGQVAQVVKYGAGSADAGAISDFGNATKTAWAYITKLGLDDEFGPVVLDALRESEVKSGWLFDEAQRRLQTLLKEAKAKTRVITETHWEKIEKVALLLLEKETISESEIRSVVTL